MKDTQGPDTHRLVHKPSQAVQKGQTSHPPNPGAPRRAVPRARLQQATRRSVPSAVRWASERRENAAGGLCQQPASSLSPQQRPFCPLLSMLPETDILSP